MTVDLGFLLFFWAVGVATGNRLTVAYYYANEQYKQSKWVQAKLKEMNELLSKSDK